MDCNQLGTHRKSPYIHICWSSSDNQLQLINTGLMLVPSKWLINLSGGCSTSQHVFHYYWCARISCHTPVGGVWWSSGPRRMESPLSLCWIMCRLMGVVWTALRGLRSGLLLLLLLLLHPPSSYLSHHYVLKLIDSCWILIADPLISSSVSIQPL